MAKAMISRAVMLRGFSVGFALLVVVGCGARATPAIAPTPTSPQPPGPIQHVIVVTVDGMVPDTYLNPDAHGLKVPVLRSIVARGAHSTGALSVFPSVTYPAHTSLTTGVVPGRHGILSNATFDPLGQNQKGWRWYAEDVKVPTIWQVAHAMGYRTALLDWPVTVGAQATFLVPEVWRARTSEDLKLIRSLSTRGLLEGVGKTYPDFTTGFQPQAVTDAAGVDLASYVLDLAKPHLTYLHIWQVDSAQHEHGLWSPEAVAAIENGDVQLGRLLQAIDRAGLTSTTAVVIASDHGFINVTRCVNPAVLLRDAGLLTVTSVDEEEKVTAWDAAILSSSGSAYVYLSRPGDAALQAKVLAVLDEAKRGGHSGIGRILSNQQVVALGGDGAAFLALEPELGTYLGGGVEQYETPPHYKGIHGLDPTRQEMKASLLLVGATIPHGTIFDARLIDVAPTVATWLGLSLPNVDGKQLVIVPAP